MVLINCNPKKQSDYANSKNLAVVCKLWGAIKFHHQEVVKNVKKWDAVLIDILDQADINHLNELELALFEKSGYKFDFSEYRQKAGYTMEKQDSWLLNHSFSKPIYRNAILNLLKTANEDTVLKVRFDSNNVINFDEEGGYNGAVFPKTSVRLLGLFRAWNILNYFNPNQAYLTQNWDTVLVHLIPKFVKAQIKTDYEHGVMELCAALEDAHSLYITNETGYDFPPFELKVFDSFILVTKVVDTAICSRQNLKAGDTIVSVKGKAVSKVIDECKSYVPKGLLSTYWRDMEYFTLHGNGYLNIGVLRNKKIEEISLELIPLETYQAQNIAMRIFFNHPVIMKFGEVTYLNVGRLNDETCDSILNLIKQTEYLVLDVRNYPEVDREKIAHFINRDTSPFTIIKWQDTKVVGRFSEEPYAITGMGIDNKYLKQVLILCNSGTQSRAEFDCMIWQSAPNVRTVGSATAAADGDVVSIPLPCLSPMQFSSIGIKYPDGTNTFKKGVKIDIPYEPSIASYIQHRDDLLNFALKQFKVK